MSKATKKVFIFATVTLLITASVSTFFFYKISVQGIRLEEQVEILTENNKRESAYIRLKRLVQETESERSTLANSFFKEEGDSITFLGEIEKVASSLGLALEVKSLDSVTEAENKQDYVRVTLNFSGQKESVFNFSRLMEVAPFHSLVESLILNRLSGEEWKGELTILLTINPV